MAQQNAPIKAKAAPMPNAERSSPRQVITPLIPKISEKILKILSFSFNKKCANSANQSGFVNKMIEDIELESPTDIAKFKNPMVPVV